MVADELSCRWLRARGMRRTRVKETVMGVMFNVKEQRVEDCGDSRNDAGE